jgi:hypothetical protein
MKLSEPKIITFWIAVAFAVLGVIGQLKIVAALTPYAFWLVLIGFVVLAAGNLVKGL